MTEPERADEPTELAIHRRLHALAELRVRGVDDPAMDKVLAKARAALIKDLLRCISAIERLPESKNPEVAAEQAVKRAGEVEFLRATIAEMGSAPQ